MHNGHIRRYTIPRTAHCEAGALPRYTIPRVAHCTGGNI